MRAPAGGQEHAVSIWKMDGGTAIFTEAAPPLQALFAPMPLRSRGPAPIRFSHRAADQRTEAAT
jgi:hypothetical protein